MANTAPESTRSNGVNPAVLLWNYELQRENKILTESSVKMQDQIAAAESLTERVTKSLEDLIVIVASLATTASNTSHSDKSCLEVIRSQLRHSLAPLAEYAEAIDNSSFLADCISDLEKLNRLPSGSIIEAAAPSTENERFNIVAESFLKPRSGAPSTVSAAPSIDADDLTLESPTASFMEANPSIVMQQCGRSLEEYYDAAYKVRRKQKRLKPVDDDVFIHLFLEGLDETLCRRRMTHWMKKEGWSWAWLEHIVMFLILEEEYMDRQDFALAHRFADGSVLLPDGTREYRFIMLPPITEEDLTPSEASQ